VKSFLASLLSDNAGGYSTIRVLMMVWILTVTGAWVFVAIYNHVLPDIPAGVLTFSAMLVGGKVAQRFGE
jgi:hypothetical protein